MSDFWQIYCIKNKLNQRCYIGKTSRTINKRFSEHIKSSNSNSQTLIHKAIRKYGPCNFELILVEDKLTDKNVDESEIFWIQEMLGHVSLGGYNLTIGGTGGPPSEEVRLKISKSLMGRKNPRYGEPGFWLGKTLSKDTKNKMSESHKRFYENNIHHMTGKDPSKCPRAKLTWDEVKKIREKYKPRKYTQIMLANEFNVSRQTINNIVNNYSWISNE